MDAIVRGNRHGSTPAQWRFIHADYQSDLDVMEQSVGVLVSLYAGLVSEHCTRYLRPEGWLLANPSHGDAAMASIDRRYRLGAVVNSRSGDYTITQRNLDSYLIPKRPTEITVDDLYARGRGIAYTKSAFAYLFQRIDVGEA